MRIWKISRRLAHMGRASRTLPAFIERGIQDLLEKKVIQPKAGPTKNAE
jgi:hypothetical protein